MIFFFNLKKKLNSLEKKKKTKTKKKTKISF